MARKGTRKDFVEWLRSKRPNTVVGTSRLFRGCPYSAYHGNAWISEFTIAGRRAPRPWELRFITAVDEEGDEVPVSARRALQLLGEDA